MSRLVIEMTDEQHQQIKAAAALNGQTIKNFVMDRLFDDDFAKLASVLEKRIADVKSGNVTGRSIKDHVALRTQEMKEA